VRGILGGESEHRDLALAGTNQPVIRFISVVLPLPLGPTRLVTPGGIERLTLLTTKHFAVKARDVGEGDEVAGLCNRGRCQRITSAPRILAGQHVEADQAEPRRVQPNSTTRGNSSPDGMRKNAPPLFTAGVGAEQVHPDGTDQRR